VPDLADKPSHILVPAVFTDGHTVGHALLFSLALLGVGVILSVRGDSRLLAVGLGSITHPLVDPVVGYPQTLFWPLLGFGFAEASGIPAWYLRGLDVELALALVLAWTRSESIRRQARRLWRTGDL